MFYIGLDLGQKRDHSAIAVVERWEHRLAFQQTVTAHFMVRHLERVPLRTPYPEVVDRVRQFIEHRELRGQVVLVVDGTGVGTPVVDLIRTAQLGCEITAVTITSGEQEHQVSGGWNVPKRDLIAGVQVLLEKRQLKIAKELREVGALLRELGDVRMTNAGANGRVRLGADGYGQHDDLVIALALACWRGRRRGIGFGGGRLPGI